MLREILFQTPLFGVTATLGVYVGVAWLRGRFRPLRALPTLPVAVALLIAGLVGFSIPYEDYKRGADGVQFFLCPVTVMLALPLHRQRKLLARHKWPVLIGSASGAATAVASVLLLSRWFGLEEALERSVLTKSVSMPFGLEITRQLGGVAGLAMLAILVTGIFGTTAAPWLCRLFRVKDPVAQGAAIGTCSHALGTARAFEMGETQGAVSSVALCLAGLFTAALVTVLQLLGVV